MCGGTVSSCGRDEIRGRATVTGEDHTAAEEPGSARVPSTRERHARGTFDRGNRIKMLARRGRLVHVAPCRAD